jgi:hypothetical protein
MNKKQQRQLIDSGCFFKWCYRQISNTAHLDVQQEVEHPVAPQHDSARVARIPSVQAPEIREADSSKSAIASTCAFILWTLSQGDFATAKSVIIGDQ